MGHSNLCHMSVGPWPVGAPLKMLRGRDQQHVRQPRRASSTERRSRFEGAIPVA